MQRYPMTRRRFLGRTLAAAAGTSLVPSIVPSHVFGAHAPSNRITFGLIGAGNKGYHWLDRELLAKPDLQVVAVCDVNRGSLGYADPKHFLGREPAQKRTNSQYAADREEGTYNGCDAYVDFREVFDRNDIDAVGIVLPDHWHAPAVVMAAAAGKDIYCEKPMTLTIGEGRETIDAVRKNNCVFQTGSQERSRPHHRHLIELVRNGRIGRIERVCTVVGPHNKVGPGPGWKPMPVPEGFDYDMWLGPAPEAPYHQDRCLYRFRFNYDYSGGQVTNLGLHCNDLAQWGLGTDDTGPVEVECLDAEFLPEGSLFDAATKTKFRCRYANGVELVNETRMDCGFGVRFEGTEGIAQIGMNRPVRTEPVSLLQSKIGPDETRLYVSDDHLQNFIDCIKTRRDPIAPVEVGHHSANVCHLGNIAVWLREKKKVLKWDPEKERFTNDDEANKLLTRSRRAPWDEV